MANFVVSAYMRGVPFLYGGQEVAFSESIPFPWDSVTIDWNQNPQVTAEFKKVLEFRTKSKAIRRGVLTDFSSDDVAAFTKVASNKKVAVFVNLRDHRTEYVVPAAMAGTYSDAYTGASVTLAEGESLPLEGFAYRALTTAHVKPVPPGPVVPSVDVLPITATLAAGTVKQLEAVVTPAGEDVTWASSDENVATVDASGLVSAVAAGTATITASTAGASGKATIDVYTPREFTVHFYRPADWSTSLNIYYWDAQPADLVPQVSWPGVAMTDDGDGWYSYVFNNITQTNLIFNDGSNQTGNLNRGEDGWYYNDTWYDTQPDTGGSTGSTSTFYYLKNRWLGTYLYDDGDQAKYGNVSDSRAEWEQLTVDGYSAFKNRATGDFLNIENEQSYVQASPGDVSFWSAQWTLETFDGYQRLRNRWRDDRYLDTERQLGYAQATAGLYVGSYSTHWELEAVNPNLSSR